MTEHLKAFLEATSNFHESPQQTISNRLQSAIALEFALNDDVAEENALLHLPPAHVRQALAGTLAALLSYIDEDVEDFIADLRTINDGGEVYDTPYGRH